MTLVRCSDGMIVNLDRVQVVCDEGGELRAWHGDGRQDYHLLAEGDEVEMATLCTEMWKELCSGIRFVDLAEISARLTADGAQ